MGNTEILMGSLDRVYSNTASQDITFCVTEECNLRCKYCYMVHKNNFRRLSIETAKAAVDFILSQDFEATSVVWDFIGGEPTLEMDLIDQLSDYIKLRMYELNHPWFSDYMFSIGTNGILYSSGAVQKYIKKNKHHLSIGITIDGTKSKHDLQRVFADNTGSYDAVIKNIPLWLKQFPNSSTKVTFASEDLVYLKESIVHLWSLGIKIIPANIVYEDVWKPDDPSIFKQQLIELADYIIENRMWEDYSVRFFDPNCGLPLSKRNKQQNFCGSGKMVAIDCDGKLYPCIRFLKFCMPDEKTPLLLLGDVKKGFDKNVREMFEKLTVDIVNDDKCEQCPIAGGCFACAGNNYACSNPHSIFTRTKYHCKMQYAQAEANDYFWDKLASYLDSPSPREQRRKATYLGASFNGDGFQYLYIILNDKATPFCMYSNKNGRDTEMSTDVFVQSLKYARNNFMLPVFLGNPEKYMTKANWNQYFVVVDSIVNTEKMDNFEFQTVIPIVTTDTYTYISKPYTVGIVLIDKNSIKNIYHLIIHCAEYFEKINIRIIDLENWNDGDNKLYYSEFARIKSWMLNNADNVQLNGLQMENESSLYSEGRRCHAGTSSWAVAPEGGLYFCPAFYYQKADNIGDIWSGMQTYDVNIFGRKKNMKCHECGVLECKECFALNDRCMHSLNIPAKQQCDFANKIYK